MRAARRLPPATWPVLFIKKIKPFLHDESTATVSAARDCLHGRCYQCCRVGAYPQYEDALVRCYRWRTVLQMGFCSSFLFLVCPSILCCVSYKPEVTLERARLCAEAITGYVAAAPAGQPFPISRRSKITTSHLFFFV